MGRTAAPRRLDTRTQLQRRDGLSLPGPMGLGASPDARSSTSANDTGFGKDRPLSIGPLSLDAADVTSPDRISGRVGGQGFVTRRERPLRSRDVLECIGVGSL